VASDSSSERLDNTFLDFVETTLHSVDSHQARRRVFFEPALSSELCYSGLEHGYLDSPRWMVFYALGRGLEHSDHFCSGLRIDPVCAGQLFCQLVEIKRLTRDVRLSGPIGRDISMLTSRLSLFADNNVMPFEEAISILVARPCTIELIKAGDFRGLEVTGDGEPDQEALQFALSSLVPIFEKLRFSSFGFLPRMPDQDVFVSTD
jgi:hypothetical protein